ncbi:transcriptional regulator [Candidatus Thorarchaeota archaeon]|nr:MAG: transcriptional regulator [Candidatus Thorarchaeota archaeon]
MNLIVILVTPAQPPRNKEHIETCPVFITSRILGKKWTILVLQTLMTPEANNGLRFSEIQNELSWISPKVLTQRLRELEDEGLLLREVDSSDMPVKVTYSLTDKGQALDSVLIEMQLWGREYGGKEAERCIEEGFEFCHSCQS